MKDKKMMDKEIRDNEMTGKQTVNDVANDNRIMLEAAKRKLHWYATEATEEEYDEEDVALLVNVVKKLEPQPALEAQEAEAQLERFRAYVNLYLEDEERRKDKMQRGGVSMLGRLRGKGLWFAAAAACILLVLFIGVSGDVVNADEDTGFFHWLKWDGERMIAITSPEKNQMGAAEADIEEFGSKEELPEEYLQYVIDKEQLSLLEEYEFQKYVCAEKSVSKKFTEVFLLSSEKKEIQMGVLSYKDETFITGEKLAGYEFLHADFYGEHRQEVFVKDGEEEKIEYMVLIHDGNKKYFVSGNEDVEFLKAVSREYMDWIFDKNGPK